MNAIKNNLLFLCLSIGLLSTSCGGGNAHNNKGNDTQDTLSVLMTSISACSRLYSAQYDLRKILVYTDTTTISGNFMSHHVKLNLPLSDRRIALPISATAKAFIDFGKLKKENVVRHGDKLEIILPDPEITLTSTAIDHKGVRKKVGLLRHGFTDEEITSIQQHGRKEILDGLAKTDILLDAQESATRLIVPIAVQCGFKEENVKVTFRKSLQSDGMSSLVRYLN